MCVPTSCRTRGTGLAAPLTGAGGGRGCRGRARLRQRRRTQGPGLRAKDQGLGEEAGRDTLDNPFL